MKAMAVAAGMDPTEGSSGRERYRVTLGCSIEKTWTSFGTSVFTGPGRTDLEDACAWGGYNTILVQRRKGPFHREEARGVLQEIVDDLLYDHSLQFVRIEAIGQFLALRLQVDFYDHHVKRWPRLRREFMEMLRACRQDPKVVEYTPSEMVLAVGPSRRRRSLVMVRAKKRGGIARLDGLYPGARFVERPQESMDTEGTPRGRGYLPFRDLLHELHCRRIEEVARRFHRVPRGAHRARPRG